MKILTIKIIIIFYIKLYIQYIWVYKANSH